MEQLRLVVTPDGPITYVFVQKQVKNLNLRVSPQGEITLSAPRRCPPERGDEFIREKSSWLHRVLHRQKGEEEEFPPLPDRVECLSLLRLAVERVYPLVAPLGVAMPEIKVRKMRSQWGNCHWMQGYITLNTALARCPEELREYVALHELVHFLHHDHGPGFYAQMDQLMPDWRQRRRVLKGCGGALEEQRKL
ncbi:YgjP-like metallopeptidase domain-containing protein [Flavonifractor sp. An100]|uniref:M48 family metallopeptidase n=1 Tax=Flavonifractor sp. An100 TaxID=1965538 RepID=UPI001302B20E|nr:YgjP-like metallopeptidase domain-containing protein [Flavonifractor sp. An100]